MKKNQTKGKIRIFYIIIPVLIVICIVELVLLLNNSNKGLGGNKNNQEPNYNDDIKLGDSTILFDSENVNYNNTSSGMSATNVKAAIDELYTKANSDSFWVKKYKTFVATPQYYAFGTYKGWCSSTDTKCNSYAVFPRTETEPPLGKNVYAAIYADGQYGVCIKRNGTEHCFRARDYTAESKHVQDVFSDISCEVDSDYVGCEASDFYCYVTSNGDVNCDDYGSLKYCNVDSSGYVKCG